VVTDEQVRLLMSLLKQGIPQLTAAAKAGMSERSARKYARSGQAPSQGKVAHTWRTRPDPFAEVWPQIETLLRQDSGLEAKTVWTEMNERYPGRFSVGQLRTLQRRFHAWRLHAAAALPLTRANRQAATRLAAAITPLRPTSRQVAALYQGWQSGTARTRELILSAPQLYLQAQRAVSAPAPSATQRWLDDLSALGGIARRARRALEQGLWQGLLAAEREELAAAFAQLRAQLTRLIDRFERETSHAG